MRNDPDVEYVLSLSYGKDSLATIKACELLGQRIDRIIHAEVWATDTIPADLPPMVEFKKKADAIIKERWGIEVEHICAMKRNVGVFTEPCEWADKLSYEEYFYAKPSKRADEKFKDKCYGFPMQRGSWCKKLKYGGWLREADIREDILQGVETNIENLSETIEGGAKPINGFPISISRGNWCTGLKTNALRIPSSERELVYGRTKTKGRSKGEYP